MELDRSTAPATAVLTRVSEATGTPILELPPLEDAIDTEALAAVVDGDNPAAQLRFRYAGYVVTVDGDRTVSLWPAEG